MPQSLVRILGHLVFSTKHREPSIDDRIRPHLHGYMAGVLQGMGCSEILIGGIDDHVHIAMALSKNIKPTEMVEDVKKQSSKWMKTQGPAYEKFYWQTGYALFSVSPSNFEAVLRYVRNQDEHHKKISFQDELRALLHKHGIRFDERYLWD